MDSHSKFPALKVALYETVWYHTYSTDVTDTITFCLQDRNDVT